MLISLSLGAQSKFEFWPGASYNPAIPTYAKVFGHEPRERILSPADLLKYLDGLNVLFLNAIFCDPAHAAVGGSESENP